MSKYDITNDLGFICDVEGASSIYVAAEFDSRETDKVSGIYKTNNGVIVNRRITTVNRTTMYDKKNEFIVVHYVGAVSTAANNASYFYSINRSSSANYFVDPTSIWQVVEDTDAAWHCGGGMQGKTGGSYFGKCTNKNSIGVELCHTFDANGHGVFDPNTLILARDLIKSLMARYNIPVEHVIRHFDVTGKNCPEPFVRNIIEWNAFKDSLRNNPHWAEEYYNKLRNLGFITSADWTRYDENVTRALTIALLDKITGGMWEAPEDDPSIHWVQPHVLSMVGKKYLDYDSYNSIWIEGANYLLSKGLLLALIDKMTGGMLDIYKGRNVDHWARNHLDSLCDKQIIQTPHAWDDDFELPVSKGNLMALLYKTYASGRIK